MFLLFPDVSTKINNTFNTPHPITRRLLVNEDEKRTKNMDDGNWIDLYPSDAMSVLFPLHNDKGEGYGYQFVLKRNSDNAMVGLSQIEYNIDINSCDIKQVNDRWIKFKLFIKFDDKWNEIKSIDYDIETVDSSKILITFDKDIIDNILEFDKEYMFTIEISELLQHCNTISRFNHIL